MLNPKNTREDSLISDDSTDEDEGILTLGSKQIRKERLIALPPAKRPHPAKEVNLYIATFFCTY